MDIETVDLDTNLLLKEIFKNKLSSEQKADFNVLLDVYTKYYTDFKEGKQLILKHCFKKLKEGLKKQLSIEENELLDQLIKDI